MEQSSAKRRKTSPTSSIPIDAPGTPSRIPVRRQDASNPFARRPSFASPTKASIARHNPQLLNRPSSSGSGTTRSRRSTKKLDDIFAKALGEATPNNGNDNDNAPAGEGTPGTQFQGTITQGNNMLPTTRRQKPLTPKAKGYQPAKSGLAAKPRRISRSPAKQARQTTGTNGGNMYDRDFQDIADPFQRKGLRRSPVPSQVDKIQDNIDPFQKSGLRRSPVVDAPPQENADAVQQPEVSNTPPGPPPAQSPEPIIPEHTGQLRELSADPDLSQKLPIRQMTAPDISDGTHLQGEPEAAEDIPQISSTSRTMDVVESDGIQPQHSPITDAISPPKPLDWRASTHSRKPDMFRRSSPFGEPELPPTPTERGIPDPIMSTPPSGILDTPSKKGRRKVIGGKLKSSPLKPQDKPQSSPANDAAAAPELEFHFEPRPENPPTRRRSARFLIPEDPHAAKKQARDVLLKELQQLQADVALTNQENERLRLQKASEKRHLAAAPNADELLAVLLRSTELPSKPKLKPASIFQSINSFLPFSRRKSQPAAIPDPEKPLPSHLPIRLDDPLPYLQAFSPLTYTSEITILPLETTTSSSNPQGQERHILQRYRINVSHPPGFFAAQLSMVVDALTLAITEIEVLKMTTSSEKELGSFVRRRTSMGTIFGKDISVICWAMGRWTEVATKRARFWCAVDREFSTTKARENSLQRMGRRNKRKRQASVILGEGNEHYGDNDSDEDTEIVQQWTTRQLLPHLGRTSFELANEEVQLLFEWNLSFDWTGEVQSSLSAYARTPKHWQKADERNSLAKIPEVFDRLVKERGPLKAVRAVVGLLMPMS